MMIILCFRCH